MTEASEEDGKIVRSLKKRPFGATVALLVVLMGACAFLCMIGVGGHAATCPAEKRPSGTVATKLAPARPPEPCTKAIPDPPVSIALIEHLPRHGRRRTPARISTLAMNTVTVRSSVTETCGSQFATGFVERPGEVVTAAHVLWGLDLPPGAEIDLLVTCDGLPHPATVMARDDRRDTLRLSVPGCDGVTIDMGDHDPSEDRTLYVAGYDYATSEATGTPLVERFLIETRGRDDDGWCEQEAKKIHSRIGLNGLSIQKDHWPPVRYGVIESLLTHGNSGSMVLDAKGAVVGMFVLFNETERFSCYVRSSEIVQATGAP